MPDISRSELESGDLDNSAISEDADSSNPEEGQGDPSGPRGQPSNTEPQSTRLRRDASSDPMRQQTEPDTPVDTSGPVATEPDTPQQGATRTQPSGSSQAPQQSGNDFASSRPEPSSSGQMGGSSTEIEAPDGRTGSASDFSGSSDGDAMAGGSNSPPATSRESTPTGRPSGTDQLQGPSGQTATPNDFAGPAGGGSQPDIPEEDRSDAVGRYILNNSEVVNTSADDPDGGRFSTDDIGVYQNESGETVVGPTPAAQRRERQELRDQAVDQYIENNSEVVNTGPNDPDGGRFSPDDITVYRNDQGEPVVGAGPRAMDRERQAEEDQSVADYIANNSSVVDTGPGDPDGGRFSTDDIGVYQNESGETVVGPKPDAVSRERQEAASEASADINSFFDNFGERTEQPSASRQRFFRTGGIPTGDNVGERGDTAAERAAKEAIAEQVSEERGQDITAEDVTLSQGSDGTVSASVEEQETFDIDYSFGLGGEEDEVENAVDSTADSIQSGINNAATDLFSADDPTGRSAGALALNAAGQEELAEDYDAGIRNFGSSFYSGAASIANVPALAGGAAEGVEVGSAAVNEAVTPGDQEFGDRASRRGRALRDQVVESANADRVGFAGQAAGALIGSYGAIAGASRVSARAGTATRYAIQPGEEIAGSVGFRATRATLGEGAATRAFPNREPLIFSEEAAISGGRRAVGGARAAARGDLELRSRASQELTSARFRAAEFANSDVPTRVNTDFSTGLSQRVRQEARSARFRASELVSSEAPTRPTGLSDRLPDVGSRLREEATSARFRAAEGRMRLTEGARRRGGAARERASDAVDDIRSTLRDLEGDDRGQAQIPTFRSRTRVDSDLEGGRTEFDTDEITEPSVGPRSSNDVMRSRARSVETNVGIDLDDAPPELAGGAAETGALGRGEAAQQPTIEFGSTRLDMGLESGFGREVEFEQRADTRTDLGFETAFDTRTQLRSRSDTDLVQETETETEFQTEGELEPRRELEVGDDRLRRRGDTTPLGGQTARSALLERDLINPFTGE